MFTSAVVGEGKSVTSANFAMAAAQSGIPTLLIETDLRKPSVNKLFGLKPEPGLTDYFYKSPRWENTLYTWEQVEKGAGSFRHAENTNGLANLRILASGKIPPNPVNLFGSERFAQLLQEMRNVFPLVVIDSAPVMLFADCTLIAPHVDGVILVYRFGRTDRDALKQSYSNLVTAKAKVLGVVVNDMLKGETTDYSSYYSAYAPDVRKAV